MSSKRKQCTAKANVTRIQILETRLRMYQNAIRDEHKRARNSVRPADVKMLAACVRRMKKELAYEYERAADEAANQRAREVLYGAW